MRTVGKMVAILMAVALLVAGVDAEAPKDAKEGGPISGAGVFTEADANSMTIWTDGEESPVKYVFGEDFVKKTTNGIFNISRVQFTYAKSDETRKLLTLKKERPAARGTVTGAVLFSDKFWVAVKPKDGPLDGYALGAPLEKAGEIGTRLLALQKGDIVTIKFHTDGERHRMESLVVVPQKAAPGGEANPGSPTNAAPAVTKTPASRPEAAPVASTTQPAVGQPAALDPAADKLKLAQLYIDNGMRDKAKDMLQGIVKAYPDTDAAKKAQAKLAELGG